MPWNTGTAAYRPVIATIAPANRHREIVNTKGPRILSFYLPQYHQIRENDEWWGEGYTEWTSVKSARQLTSRHLQPKIPLHGNYYDLSKTDTLRWQADLAAKCGISGFCFYHYWFNGRKILETPAENLLRETSINLSFCFCWANESWTRTWYGDKKTVLLRQDYGGRESWKAHFEYLLPFFRDARYIKKDDMPVLLIYRSELIEDLDGMLQFFDEQTRRHGFSGIYSVLVLGTFNNDARQQRNLAYCYHEPGYTYTYGMGLRDRWLIVCRKQLVRYLNRVGKRKRPVVELSYDRIYNKVLKNKLSFQGKPAFGCSFPNWDNTPRRKHNGYVIYGSTPPAFAEKLAAHYGSAAREGHEFFFINAWNEWGEGAYLEPDETYQYDWLNAVRRAVAAEGGDGALGGRDVGAYGGR
jgi:hypothetical protein